MHRSLTPAFNRKLMLAWASIVFAVMLWNWRASLPAIAVGIILGLILGLLQYRAVIQSSVQLLSSETALDVRRALTSNSTGQLYIRLLWISFALLLLAAIQAAQQQPLVPYVGGLAAMWLVREGLTYRATLRLATQAVGRRGVV
jgi:hypothetical protein